MKTIYEFDSSRDVSAKPNTDVQLCLEASEWEAYADRVRWGEMSVEEAELVYHGWLTCLHTNAQTLEV